MAKLVEYTYKPKHKPGKPEPVWSTKSKKKRIKKPRAPKDRSNRTWLEIQRDFLRWKKTEDFTKWRKKQFLKQGGTCYYCDVFLIGARENVEHVIPKSKGGENVRQNLVLACSECNRKKYTTELTKGEKKHYRTLNKTKRGTYLHNKEAHFSMYESTDSYLRRMREIHG